MATLMKTFADTPSATSARFVLITNALVGVISMLATLLSVTLPSSPILRPPGISRPPSATLAAWCADMASCSFPRRRPRRRRSPGRPSGRYAKLERLVALPKVLHLPSHLRKLRGEVIREG